MKSNLLKKIITQSFDQIFIACYYDKNYELEEAKKTAYYNTSLRATFFITAILIFGFILIMTGIFKINIPRIYLYIILYATILLLYFTKKTIQKYIIEPNVDFNIEKYTETYIKSNRKRIMISIIIFSLTGMSLYIFTKLASWILNHF